MITLSPLQNQTKRMLDVELPFVSGDNSLMIRPKYRTRVTMYKYENRMKKDVEVCQSWMPVEEWKEWTSGCVVSQGFLVRKKNVPPPGTPPSRVSSSDDEVNMEE